MFLQSYITSLAFIKAYSDDFRMNPGGLSAWIHAYQKVGLGGSRQAEIVTSLPFSENARAFAIQ